MEDEETIDHMIAMYVGLKGKSDRRPDDVADKEGRAASIKRIVHELLKHRHSGALLVQSREYNARIRKLGVLPSDKNGYDLIDYFYAYQIAQGSFDAALEIDFMRQMRRDEAAGRAGRPFSLTSEQQDDARQRHAKGETLTSIAHSYNVSKMTLSRLMRGVSRSKKAKQ